MYYFLFSLKIPVSPQICLGSQKVCGVRMDPILKLFETPRGVELAMYLTCWRDPAFVSWLMV
jgi:hypothetical protein